MSRYGIMMNYDELAHFFEDLGTILDDLEVEVDAEFPLKYTHAVNTVRYLCDKTSGKQAREIKRSKSVGYTVDCGNCGFSLDASPHYKFCPNCGFKILRENT